MDRSAPFNIFFWGVRGSHPVPGEHTQRYGGNTPCVEVRAGNQILIFDAGSGIIAMGQQFVRQAGGHIKASLFFSHLHHDHIQGLPFFTPLYRPGSQLDFYLPLTAGQDANQVLETMMSPPYFPINFWMTASVKRLHQVHDRAELILGDEDPVRVHSLYSHAHPQGVMIYRVEWRDRALVYATDTEGYMHGDQRLVKFARDADLLIHDAQYTQAHYLGEYEGAPITQGFGHSTTDMACETARAAGVGQLVLFHHDPLYDDQKIGEIERRARQLFPNTLAAREGMCLQLNRPPVRAEQTLRLPSYPERPATRRQGHATA